MKAIVMDGYGGPDVLRLSETTRCEPAAGEVLIRVAAIGVNPADAKWRSGMFQSFRPLGFPHILGYDVAGVVEQAPPDSGLAKGDRVGAMLESLRQGAYAGYAAVAPAGVALLPDGLEFDRAAAVPTPGLTGVQLVEAHLEVQSGQTVLVTGAAGAVGRFAVWAAKARGARVVAAVRPSQFEVAKRLGADEVVALGERWNGGRFDGVADTVGGADVALLCRHLAPRGAIFTAATTPIPEDGLEATPQFVAVRPDAKRLATLMQAVGDGRIEVPVALVLPLERAAEAHRRVEQGGLGGKVILRP